MKIWGRPLKEAGELFEILSMRACYVRKSYKSLAFHHAALLRTVVNPNAVIHYSLESL